MVEHRIGERETEQLVVYDFTGYPDKGIANAGRKRHTEEKVAEQIGVLVKIMNIDEKHRETNPY